MLAGERNTGYVASENQIADVFTKALSKDRHVNSLSKLTSDWTALSLKGSIIGDSLGRLLFGWAAHSCCMCSPYFFSLPHNSDCLFSMYSLPAIHGSFFPCIAYPKSIHFCFVTSLVASKSACYPILKAQSSGGRVDFPSLGDRLSDTRSHRSLQSSLLIMVIFRRVTVYAVNNVNRYTPLVLMGNEKH